MGYSLARPVATHTTTERALCLCMPAELRSASWCRDGDGRFAGEIDRKYSTRSRVRPVRPGPRPEHVGAGAFPNAAYPTRLGFGQTDRRRRRLRSKGSCGAIRCRLHLDKEAGRTVHTATGHQPIPIPQYARLSLCPSFDFSVPSSRPFAQTRTHWIGEKYSSTVASHRTSRSPPPCNAAGPLRWYYRISENISSLSFNSFFKSTGGSAARIGPTKKPDYKW